MTDPIAHHDVIIVGAGLSGIGAAYYMKHKSPTALDFVVLESRDKTGAARPKRSTTPPN